jgi:hypothetical protein
MVTIRILISEVFDKSKTKPMDIPKSSMIELRSSIQALLERVSELELKDRIYPGQNNRKPPKNGYKFEI